MKDDFLTSSSENFARRREGRSSALRVFFCISLSFSRGKGFCSPLSRAWSLRLRNSSNHSKARVVWYPRLSEIPLEEFLIIIAERAPREKEGTTTRSLIKSSFFSRVNSEIQKKVNRACSFSAQRSFYHHEIQLSE